MVNKTAQYKCQLCRIGNYYTGIIATYNKIVVNYIGIVINHNKIVGNYNGIVVNCIGIIANYIRIVASYTRIVANSTGIVVPCICTFLNSIFPSALIIQILLLKVYAFSFTQHLIIYFLNTIYLFII